MNKDELKKRTKDFPPGQSRSDGCASLCKTSNSLTKNAIGKTYHEPIDKMLYISCCKL
jgi:hypothetical protein